METGIYKKILLRVGVVWALLSILAVALVYEYEHGRVDDLVLSLAVKEAGTFDTAVIDKITSYDVETIEELQRMADHLVKTHFVMVDIYDVNQGHIVTSFRYDDIEMLGEMESRHHRFPLDHQLHSERFHYRGDLFMQVLLPLVSSQGDIVGYFEGVYLLDRETLAEINQQLYTALATVVVIILLTAMILVPVIASMNRRLIHFSGQLMQANIELLDVVGSAIALRDTTTNSHNYRVTLYAVALAEALNLPKAAIRDLIVGAFLHDVGKIGVSDVILRKPGPLDTKEQCLMQAHVHFGVELASKSRWLGNAREVIEFHHERYDGSGYIRGLKGDEIPLNARIFTIADVFDALTTERPYKKALSFEVAMEMLKLESGKHFDPVVLQRFNRLARGAYHRLNRASEQKLHEAFSRLLGTYFYDGNMAPLKRGVSAEVVDVAEAREERVAARR